MEYDNLQFLEVKQMLPPSQEKHRVENIYFVQMRTRSKIKTW